MKLIFRYLGRYKWSVLLVMAVKLVGTMAELTLPYILEHLLDKVVPLGQLGPVIFWGLLMIAAAIVTRQLNVAANRRAVENAHNISYDVRQALFHKTVNLSGSQFDAFGLPSLISRMTSDSYNVQSCVQSLQTLCVRAPILLVGSIIMALTMDVRMALIMCVMAPVLILVCVGVSRFGIPLYNKVQQRLDDVVRIMREDITGIRVVKALSKEEYEKSHFGTANEAMAKSDIKASTIMAVPGPAMQMCLNIGLTLVVVLGAYRVNGGQMDPGVILAFLTYFNMIMMGVMGLNRVFMMLSKASASADRIDLVLGAEEDQTTLPAAECPAPVGDEFIRFEHVDFSYGSADDPAHEGFAGAEREKCLYDISFALNRGESLGIIGSTGCGKSTILNLLMRFYDVDAGGVFVDGKDVRAYEKDDLHRKFGVVFQNDMVFNDTLRRNIDFGRGLEERDVLNAVEDAMAAEFIGELDAGLDYMADIKGANLSGGQKQRLLIARALAGQPEILILDDSSSALDYKTDAALRKAIFARHRDAAVIMVAQRVSSVQSMTNILVLEEGRCIGYGSHAHLLETCPAYHAIYETQMGSMT